MSRFSRVLSLFAVPVLFAACSPGATDTPLSPASPRHDGGSAGLGGNFVPPDTTSQGTTSSTTSASAEGTLGAPSAATDSTSRGGSAGVGGN
jgi:hypothetical protein